MSERSLRLPHVPIRDSRFLLPLLVTTMTLSSAFFAWQGLDAEDKARDADVVAITATVDRQRVAAQVEIRAAAAKLAVAMSQSDNLRAHALADLARQQPSAPTASALSRESDLLFSLVRLRNNRHGLVEYLSIGDDQRTLVFDEARFEFDAERQVRNSRTPEAPSVSIERSDEFREDAERVKQGAGWFASAILLSTIAHVTRRRRRKMAMTGFALVAGIGAFVLSVGWIGGVS